MRARDVMTPDPVCISLDASIAEAIELMSARRFRALPVVDANGSLVGIVTEGDLLRRIETATPHRRSTWMEFILGSGRLADEHKQAAGRAVKDVMTPDLRTVDEET